MSEKRQRNKKKYKNVKSDTTMIECDECFGFIAEYTTNRVPYGMTLEEMDGIRGDTKNEIT